MEHLAKNKNFKLIKMAKMSGLIFLIIVIALLVIGYIYEAISFRNVQTNFPPHGEMMDINGHKLHVKVMGTLKDNQYPIVIETGTGNWSYDWIEVQQVLSKHTQVLTYDRAGNGWSEPSTEQITVETVLEDLKAVIDQANLKRPVILIGHSTGGLYTRLFAEKYPEYVVGMVLVDARNEYFSEKSQEFNEKFFKTQNQTMTKILSKFGVVRLIGANLAPPNFPINISMKEYVNVHWDYDFFNTVEQEMKQIPVAEKLLMPSKSLGSMPITVLTPEGYSMPIAPLGFSEEVEMQVNVTWKESQEWLSTLSPNSEYIQVPKAGHSIMYDNPQIIVESVLQILLELNYFAYSSLK